MDKCNIQSSVLLEQQIMHLIDTNRLVAMLNQQEQIVIVKMTVPEQSRDSANVSDLLAQVNRFEQSLKDIVRQLA